MSRLPRLLLLIALATSLLPLAARADSSRCTAKIRAMGYFILDIDSDWDRPYDKFSAVLKGREYDIWVDRSTCKVVHRSLDDDRTWPD
ncbi:MAG: hypothetical protein VKN15_03180 [Cyanobacteriota bacterium]|nr:hypothetical protein [Cyanobacteriota bacterium]